MLSRIAQSLAVRLRAVTVVWRSYRTIPVSIGRVRPIRLIRFRKSPSFFVNVSQVSILSPRESTVQSFTFRSVFLEILNDGSPPYTSIHVFSLSLKVQKCNSSHQCNDGACLSTVKPRHCFWLYDQLVRDPTTSLMSLILETVKTRSYMSWMQVKLRI
jgi:hypothetical protein